MHVLHVIPAVAPRYGGPSHAVVGMGRALPHEGAGVLRGRGGVGRKLQSGAAIQYTTAAERRLAEIPLGLHHGVVIPLGVDAELFAEPLEDNGVLERDRPFDGQPYILVLGRLHPKKGLELLLDVFIRLASAAPYSQWRLVIAGDGDAQYVAGLKQLIRPLGGGDNVLMVGWPGG